MSARLIQQRAPLAKTNVYRYKPSYVPNAVYLDPFVLARREGGLMNSATVYVSNASYIPDKSVLVVGIGAVGISTAMAYAQSFVLDQLAFNQALAESLCEQHPTISTYPGIFGGVPHLNGLRLSVADILGQLYLTGSIEAVHKIYSPDVSEDQIKEAIAYAQDFLESALSSSSKVNG